ncbi:MAG: ABC transporter substrate-binding protein [Deltaproteobacteria bacterium]|nr:ABC transporter substrate-binding protein [Deltaproteobacteria bacterium]
MLHGLRCENKVLKKVVISLLQIFLFLLILYLPGRTASAREIIDMAGRHVVVPDVINKVFGSSPPATYMIYAIDPGMIAGLNASLRSPEKQYMDARIHQLPVVGGQQGQGAMPDFEVLLKIKPDIILVWMWKQLSASNEKLEQKLKTLGIPVVYIAMDSLTEYPHAFRFLGDLLNRKERAEALAIYAEQTLIETKKASGAIQNKERVSVYYAEGVDGLSTECDTSVHAQLIPLSGGANVHQCNSATLYGMQKISMEQVINYDPHVIVSHDSMFLSSIKKDVRWRNIRAVRDGHVYRIPTAPFNWFDRPPSFMRLLGLKWMTNQLYPDAYTIDMNAEARRFYKLFLNVTLDEASTREILQQ